MLLLSLNKTGLWTILMLLLGVSLYPACGRPSFQDEDEDTVADEGHEKEDDNENQEHADEDDDDENDPTPSTQTEDKCLNLGKKIMVDFELLEFCEKTAKVAQDRRKGGDGGGAAGGAAAGGAKASTGGKDEYGD